jgi:hypothetical protein
MCELYQHEFILSHDKGWNPNPFVEDVQLTVFTSFLRHQVQWSAYVSYN